MPEKKENKSSFADFWQEYEEETGEKVLQRGLGRYISGWEEFDKNKWEGTWGLVISTSGGFRFHHFPKTTWLDSLVRSDKHEKPKEKTIFIRKENIISVSFNAEKKWWKKLLFSPPPQLVITYTDNSLPETDRIEKRLLFEAEYTS